MEYRSAMDAASKLEIAGAEVKMHDGDGGRACMQGHRSRREGGHSRISQPHFEGGRQELRDRCKGPGALGKEAEGSTQEDSGGL